MGATKTMRPEALLGLDFSHGNQAFILGRVSSYGKTIQQGCTVI